MIIIQIRGGLGNQLFTYAIAYALAKDSGNEIMLDKQLYQTFYKLRDFQLEQFKVDTSKVLMKRSLGSNKISKKVYNLIHDWKIKHIYHAVTVKEKKEFTLQEISVPQKQNLYLTEGYWQCHEYFDRYRKDIRKIFQPRNESIWEKYKGFFKYVNDTTVAVHIRRGDYKVFKGGKCLSIDYYKEAMKMMKNQLGESCNFMIFTDDVEFCKEQFRNEKKVLFFADLFHTTDVEEFVLMSKCRHFIIANSSFSWWAAYLADNNEKKVIAPVVDMWEKSFYLPEWTTLDSRFSK